MSVLPNSGITVSKVAETLATTCTDVGRLCKHDNVNKWSKYKPVISSDPTRKSTDLPYISGISYSGIIDTSIAIAQAERGEYGWEYEKPTVGPYRLGDFCSYNHQAVCPIKVNIPDKIVEMQGAPPVVTVEIDSEIGGFDPYYNVSCGGILKQYEDDYTLAVAVSSGNNPAIVKTYYSTEAWSTINTNAKMVTIDQFDELDIPFGTVKLSTYLCSNNKRNGVSLEAYEGASRKYIQYEADTLLASVNSTLDSLNWFHGSASGRYMTYDMRWTTFNVYTEDAAEFYNRYCAGAYGTYVKWKVQLYPEDVKINNTYYTHTWVDLTQWSVINDKFDPDLSMTQLEFNREDSDFTNIAGYIDLDYEAGNSRTHEFKIRLLMQAYDYRHGTYEKVVGEHTFTVPVNGADIII